MLFFPDLKSRHLVPELMDDPNLPAAEHQLALHGLRRINRFSGTVSSLCSTILDLIKPANASLGQSPGLQSPLVLLDIGCANGENLLAVYRQLAKSISVRCIGWDISPYAIQSAKALASSAGLSEDQLRFEVVDALGEIDTGPIDTGPHADIVMNSLFMHHFEESSVVDLLSRSAQLARVAVVADDLNRTQLGWFLAKTGCWLLSSSRVVRFDGPQSVRAAFTCTEIASIADRAGLENYRITKHWPERYALVWRRSPLPS
ncbi:MAG: methyltransferase domain-containing protein [Planctomycetota bacterium]|nr:methyltransferase domain-containing protein [Planctomycetota bacterium]